MDSARCALRHRVDESLLWVWAQQLMDCRAPPWPSEGAEAATTAMHTRHLDTQGLVRLGLAALISCTTKSDTKTLRDPDPVPAACLACWLLSQLRPLHTALWGRTSLHAPRLPTNRCLPGESCPFKVQPRPSSCLGLFLITCLLYQAKSVIPSLPPNPLFPSIHSLIHSLRKYVSTNHLQGPTPHDPHDSNLCDVTITNLLTCSCTHSNWHAQMHT